MGFVQAMDRISGLPDELVIKLLLLLPTKVAVSTSILSKRWEFLWMWLPKLTFIDRYDSESESKRFKYFLNRNLALHRAPVIESLRLQVGRRLYRSPEDVKLWVAIAVCRIIHELDISYRSPNLLPSSLYTCKSLVTLKLKGTILVDVPRTVCLPSLKTLRLKWVTFFNECCLQRLLSNCPVLEDLFIDSREGQHLRRFIVIVPSLQRLSLYILEDVDEFVINTPSLKYLKLGNYTSETYYFSVKNMSKLREADVGVQFPDLKILIKSITSVERLKLCVEDNINSELCLCQDYLPNIIFRLLKDSPNLQVLDLYCEDSHEDNGLICHNRPSTVPECMLSSLQTFTWSDYLGRPEDRDLAGYILENSRCLKTATISSNDSLVPKLEMITELALSSRASSTCKLVFC